MLVLFTLKHYFENNFILHISHAKITGMVRCFISSLQEASQIWFRLKTQKNIISKILNFICIHHLQYCNSHNRFQLLKYSVKLFWFQIFVIVKTIKNLMSHFSHYCADMLLPSKFFKSCYKKMLCTNIFYFRRIKT